MNKMRVIKQTADYEGGGYFNWLTLGDLPVGFVCNVLMNYGIVSSGLVPMHFPLRYLVDVSLLSVGILLKLMTILNFGNRILTPRFF